jgi:signal transduction histidine kinase/DNA-binding response OmpR family regulator
MENFASLPLPRTDTAREAPAPNPHLVDVLVVDDDPRNLAATGALLAGSGARLLEARSGEEALRILLSREVALILLDVHLPGISGLETARLVRSRVRSRHTPIIFFTAHGDDEQLRRGYALGAVDFLSKPVPDEALRGKVAFFIEAHRNHDALRRHAELLRAAQERELARNMADARRGWEEESLRREMEREKRIIDTLHRANQRLRLLSGVRSELLAADGVRARLPSICAHVAAQLGLERYAVHVARPDGRFELVAHGGAPEGALDALAGVDGVEALIGGTAPRVSARGEAGPPVAEALGVACCVARACFGGARPVAAIAFGSTEKDRCDEDDLETLELVGYALAMALERDALIAELQMRNGELNDADRRKDQFLAMLAHELRNPLAPILNATRLLQEDGVGEDGRRRAIDAADRQVRHMARLVDDLLDVSRIRSGKVRLRKEPVDLCRVVRDSVQAVEPIVQARRHSLSVNVPAGQLVAVGDAVRLTQVVENVLTNAAKYTDPGGHLAVTLAASSETAASIIVTDDGIGMGAELLPRVFDLFVQAEQAADRSRGGLGIGLSLVKSLVEMHGGTVAARSDGPGTGSTIEVSLPLAPGATVTAAPAQPPPSAAVRAAPRDLLVVEDNDDIRETLGELLRHRGHAVRVADGGAAALALAAERAPDVALVDIGLPELDGYAVAARLHEIAPGARLVALTGYGGADDRRRAADAGFEAHLVKPVDFDELTAVIEALS